MKHRPSATYNRGVGRYLLFLLCWAIFSGARASADPQDIATTNAPVVFAQVKHGSITVRTWDRPDVQIDADPNTDVRHIPQERVAQARQLPPGMFMFWQQQMQTPDGTPLTIPPEQFPVTPLDAEPHDAVAIRNTGDGGNITITVPTGSPIVEMNVAQGDVTVNGYHNGTFISHIGRGRLTLNNVSGTVGAQINNGVFSANNSQFDRIRVRSMRGMVAFQNCNSRQIEVTTLASPIIYDNGRFAPGGPARFESQTGNVAIGVAGGVAQVDAHSGSGHVISEGNVRGGPVVTATSASGNIGYYNGSMREHPNIQQQFPRLGQHVQHVPQPRRVRRFPLPRPTRRPSTSSA